MKNKVIAEIGKNFVVTQEPEPVKVLLSRAKLLIYGAKKAGADIVKFQIHADDEIHPHKALISPHFAQDRREWIKRNTYPADFWFQIKEYCREIGIEFLATPMSRGAAEFLDEIGVDAWKISSGDVTDFVLLDYIRDSGKPVILSSGMSSLEELKKAYNYLKEKTNDVSILHCVSIYPCPAEKLNLGTIPFLKRQFPKATIGFSDHSLEISTGAIAVQMGAKIIEKHFTLDRSAFGPDHKVSLLPNEFAQMIKEIQSGKKIDIPPTIKGIETKYIQDGEMPFRKVFRKGLYASRNIKVGQLWESDMFYAMRPQNGTIPADNYPLLLGTKIKRDYKQYDKIYD